MPCLATENGEEDQMPSLVTENVANGSVPEAANKSPPEEILMPCLATENGKEDQMPSLVTENVAIESVPEAAKKNPPEEIPMPGLATGNEDVSGQENGTTEMKAPDSLVTTEESKTSKSERVSARAASESTPDQMHTPFLSTTENALQSENAGSETQASKHAVTGIHQPQRRKSERISARTANDITIDKVQMFPNATGKLGGSTIGQKKPPAPSPNKARKGNNQASSKKTPPVTTKKRTAGSNNRQGSTKKRRRWHEFPPNYKLCATKKIADRIVNEWNQDGRTIDLQEPEGLAVRKFLGIEEENPVNAQKKVMAKVVSLGGGDAPCVVHIQKAFSDAYSAACQEHLNQQRVCRDEFSNGGSSFIRVGYSCRCAEGVGGSDGPHKDQHPIFRHGEKSYLVADNATAFEEARMKLATALSEKVRIGVNELLEAAREYQKMNGKNAYQTMIQLSIVDQD
jgi:hypothetical protein